MFAKGDKLVHYTKYGGINIIEIAEIIEEINFDTSNKLVTIDFIIKSTKGITYDLNGIDGKFKKFKANMSDKGKERLENLLNYMQEKKQFHQKVMDGKIEQLKGNKIF